VDEDVDWSDARVALLLETPAPPPLERTGRWSLDDAGMAGFWRHEWWMGLSESERARGESIKRLGAVSCENAYEDGAIRRV
jgi:hypothetical protein